MKNTTKALLITPCLMAGIGVCFFLLVKVMNWLIDKGWEDILLLGIILALIFIFIFWTVLGRLNYPK